MSIRHIIFIPCLIMFASLANAQTSTAKVYRNKENMPSNTLPAHKWWNLLHYTIDITPDYNTRFITGTNSIKFTALQTGNEMHIDLYDPMHITAITWKSSPIEFKKVKDTYIITFPEFLKTGGIETITIHFEGHPKISTNPPFDNGWIWATDKKGRPWISVACEGSGASIWLPCKEVLYDEPDNGISFSITVPDTLTAIANGRLKKKLNNKNKTTTYIWTVVNPINNYNIIPSIGKYVTWHEDYPGAKGNLDCDYWVLDYSLDKAKRHLKQTDTMLQCFEYWLGAYPFYEDSYKLIEVPFPGMEHQSAVAYGNGFVNGYAGKDISGTGWGLKWDFMMVHESGHEWFGNSITTSNYGDTWIHEGFTKYLEVIYTNHVFGREAGNDYATGIWKRIKNDKPILGTSTSDKYYKGSAMLHMIRQIIGDTIFRGWLQRLNREFYHQTVNTKQILSSLNDYTKRDFTKIFEQYLQTTQVPVLEYSFQNNTLEYRWANCVDGFAMPVKISFDNDKYNVIYPTTQRQKLSITEAASKRFVIDRNFYIGIKEQRVKR